MVHRNGQRSSEKLGFKNMFYLHPDASEQTHLGIRLATVKRRHLHIDMFSHDFFLLSAGFSAAQKETSLSRPAEDLRSGPAADFAMESLSQMNCEERDTVGPDLRAFR